MKEYKVIKPSLGFRKRHEKLEDLINKYAKEGWTLKTITDNQHGGISYIVFEREKNR
ncbi:DUF4177 domain-containing protein [Geojedonia litorea]|uniref:DUF4177 domain-containing protein n=1 Tax=Geojedonia litorea TaxID=1268269 RepID=A0ABV9N1E1_9FLAO